MGAARDERDIVARLRKLRAEIATDTSRTHHRNAHDPSIIRERRSFVAVVEASTRPVTGRRGLPRARYRGRRQATAESLRGSVQ
jgi:hypothetical protein